MPGVDGFGVLRELERTGTTCPDIVFVTAFDSHAVAAFDVLAFDYVLKPIEEARFARVLDRLTQARAERAAVRSARELLSALDAARSGLQADASPPAEHLTRFAIRSGGRTVFLKADDVDWIEADGYYVTLHVGTRSLLHRETMTALEQQLDPRRFVRVHCSAIVNVDRVVELQPYDRGHYTLVLRSGQRLRMSRSRREQLAAVFG